MRMKISFKQVLSFFLVLWPILDTYVILSGISLGEMLVIASCLLCVLIYGKIQCGRERYLYLYILLVSMIGGLIHYNYLTNSYAQNIFSYVLYALILFCVLTYADKNAFLQIYIKVSKGVCYLSLIQFLLLCFGVKFVQIIPGIPNITEKSYFELQNHLLRMCGPFTEPAHLVQFLSVAIVILLFGTKKDNKTLVLYIVTAALTLSGNGLAIIGATIGVKILYSLKEKSVKIRRRAVGAILGLCIILVIMYFNVPEFKRLLMRASEITGNSNVEVLGYVSASGYFRVKYGFDIFINSPPLNQLFGLGAGVFSAIYNLYDVVPSSLDGVYNSSLLLYRSGFTTILIDFGLIGMLIYLSFLFRKRSRQSKQVALVLIILQLIASIINTSIWVIYILLFIAFDVKEKEEVVTSIKQIEN